MDHWDHVALLRPAVRPGGTWADVGSGRGAFTLALAELLGAGSRIVSIDLDREALAEQGWTMRDRFPGIRLDQVVADFRTPLELPVLDGIVMANALHFVPRDHQPGLVRTLAAHLKPAGRFVIVEYDADRGNPWVPHPFTAEGWERLAAAAGLVGTRPMGRLPSRFLGAIYSAVSERPADAVAMSTPPTVEPVARPGR